MHMQSINLFWSPGTSKHLGELSLLERSYRRLVHLPFARTFSQLKVMFHCDCKRHVSSSTTEHTQYRLPGAKKAPPGGWHCSSSMTRGAVVIETGGVAC